jgi:hypothetical protein
VTWPPPPPAADPAEGAPLTRSTVVLHVASDVRMVAAATPAAGGGFIELGSTGHGLRLTCLDRDAARRLHEATGLLLTEIDKQIRFAGGQQHLTAVPNA